MIVHLCCKGWDFPSLCACELTRAFRNFEVSASVTEAVVVIFFAATGLADACRRLIGESNADQIDS